MENFVEHTLEPYFNYWIYVILMMIGLWAVIAKNNLIKKLIGLSIFQTAIILFYVSLGVKEDSTIPILDHHAHAEESAHGGEDPHHAEEHGNKEAKPHSENPHASDRGDHVDAADSSHGSEDSGHDSHAVDPDSMANPLPHVLMLTAIVVGVATLGVALALTQMIYLKFGSLEEDEILEAIREGGADD